MSDIQALQRKRLLKRPKLTKFLAAVAVVSLPLFGWAAVAHAQSFRSGNNATVPAGQTVDSSLFATGRTIDIAGTVNGDVICAGQNVTVTGTVTGDIICAGQTVRISGKVNGNVRVAGQTVTIGGNIGRNVSAAGQQLTTEANSTVEGDVSVGGQDAALNGQVGRDLAVASSTATINGKVGRDVQGSLEQLTLGHSAAIGRDLRYTSPQDAKRESGAQVVGLAQRTAPKPQQHDNGDGKRFAGLLTLWFFVSLLIFALALVLLMPQVFERVVSSSLPQLGKTFLIGFVASVIVPVIIVALFATLIGIPLAVLLLMTWLILLILSGPFAAYLTGRLLLRKRANNAILTMLLGAVILLILYVIPFVGQLMTLVAVWFGLGLMLNQVRHLPKIHYKIEPTVTSDSNIVSVEPIKATDNHSKQIHNKLKD